MATALVTGANRGIGLELVRQLIARGDTVYAACRSASDALAATSATIIADIDVGSSTCVPRLSAALKDVSLDLCICNAGVLHSESLSTLNEETMLQQFNVNSLGPLRTVQAVKPSLRAGAKVGIVTSRMGSISDNTSGGYYGYRMSKAAVNAAGASLARDLAGDGIAVMLLHPGFVRTEMTGGQGMIDAPESARGLIARLDELTVETSGSFRHMSGESLPW